MSKCRIVKEELVDGVVTYIVQGYIYVPFIWDEVSLSSRFNSINSKIKSRTIM